MRFSHSLKKYLFLLLLFVPRILCAEIGISGSFSTKGLLAGAEYKTRHIIPYVDIGFGTWVSPEIFGGFVLQSPTYIKGPNRIVLVSRVEAGTGGGRVWAADGGSFDFTSYTGDLGAEYKHQSVIAHIGAVASRRYMRFVGGFGYDMENTEKNHQATSISPVLMISYLKNRLELSAKYLHAGFQTSSPYDTAAGKSCELSIGYYFLKNFNIRTSYTIAPSYHLSPEAALAPSDLFIGFHYFSATEKEAAAHSKSSARTNPLLSAALNLPCLPLGYILNKEYKRAGLMFLSQALFLTGGIYGAAHSYNKWGHLQGPCFFCFWACQVYSWYDGYKASNRNNQKMQ